ncbi:MAG: hypothetical protein IIV90_04935, partial [Oscillospiraceae bacterium]|nr:hypothetical protein [Oscillospiraceae bacterium]
MFFSAFMDILDRSIVASFVILIVLLARRLLAPRFDARIWFPLWGVVLIRLLIPFTSSFGVSLIPARLFSLPQNAALPLSGQVSFSAAALSAYHAVGDTLNGGID